MTTPIARGAADFSDQTGIFNPAHVIDTLTVIGCGGIGASALPTLVTMGFRRFVLWDGDIIEPRNLTTQPIFTAEDLYKSKVEAARDFLLAHGAEEVEIRKRAFTAEDHLEGIVVSAVDSMAARQVIWQAITRIIEDSALEDPVLLLDGRIGGTHGTLLTVELFNADWYAKWLFDDTKAAPLPCTERTVVYPAVMLGALMAAQLALWSRHKPTPQRIDHNAETHFYQTVGVNG